MTHTKRWLIPPPLTHEANENLAAFPLILRQILFNRGYATDAEARAFLKAEPAADTDPFLMSGMQAAVDRIQQALANSEPVAIYGDYDVDGVTATALLVETLHSLGGKVREYIPNRFDEGYGLNTDALDSLKAGGVRLVITVDCGIRSPAEAAHARAIGLDLIITDHHEPAGDLPQALAVINPKQAGDAYPEKYLAGVGIAYKMAQALFSLQPSSSSLDSFLDLVALGTVADLAPLTGENRVLVRGGLRQLRLARRQGVFALANVAGITLSKVTAVNIGFGLGPRLNASGRMESALASFKVLTTTDVFEAGQLAQQLDVQNRERQRLTRDIQENAELMALAEESNPLILFAVSPDFNPGVVGLAAARLTETHYRPAVVGHYDGQNTRCSCRSIPEFHITKALDECADLLVRHGGHAAAAGFTVPNERLGALQARLKSIAGRELAGLQLRPTLVADAEVQLTHLKQELLRQLDTLEPTGYGNPEPVFVARNVRVVNARTVGSDARHLKMTVSDGKAQLDAIGFRFGHLLPDLPARVDLMFTFETNEYNGRTSLQLNLKDVKPAGAPD